VIEDLFSEKGRLAVVGLGYVGLPLCVSFGTVFRGVIGFDINSSRIGELTSGHDRTGEIAAELMKKASMEFTSKPERLKEARIIIIAVPTPVNAHKIPDLEPLKSVSKIVGTHMARGVTVVYESTVYPGLTEDICGPILEQYSGMKTGVDFKLGYSPERINPGDDLHTLENIVKIVSGQDAETTELLAALYGTIVKAGIHRTPDIRTAEASKVIENIQRDLNIALMNELSIIFCKLGIDTKAVLAAARTKWNFLPFEPGLVGGHCIGVDPYYLTYKALEVDYHPDVILAGRRINDHMGKYVAEQTIKELIKSGICFTGNRILILGCTFKENVKDVRNSKVMDIFNELRGYGVTPLIYDPVADKDIVRSEYAIELIDGLEDHLPYDGIVVAVGHSDFQALSLDYLRSLCGIAPVFIDVKGIYDRDLAKVAGFRYWRL
jgi:UDP-N-acetyl-D-galactosamine dehydrogenase